MFDFTRRTAEEKRREETEFLCPPGFVHKTVPAMPGSLSLLWSPRTLVPPAFVYVLFHSFLAMATFYVFSPPNHDSSLWSPFLHLITSFSPCKVILQVEVGRLGLWTGNWLVRGFSLNPCSPQGLKPEGLLKLCAADIQLLLIQKDCRLGILSAPSSRQRLLCPVNAVRVS